jgi:hypothetical protein
VFALTSFARSSHGLLWYIREAREVWAKEGKQGKAKPEDQQETFFFA